MKKASILFALGFLTTLGAAHAADLKKTGPLVPATALIMARGGEAQESGIEFTYKIEGGPMPGTLTIDLAKDFSVIDDNSRTLVIYDYAIKRIVVLNDQTHKFGNSSLYGPVALRVQDRHASAVTFTPSTHAMSKDEGARFARLLDMMLPLDRASTGAMAASGSLPQTIAFQFGAAQVSWTLQSAVVVTAVDPMVSSRKPPQVSNADVVKAFGEAFAQVTNATLGQAKRRTPDEYNAAVEAALAHRKPFQALLLALQRDEEYGAGACPAPRACRTTKALFVAAAKDKRTAKFAAALRPAKDQTQVIKDLAGMKRDDLSDAAVLDLTLGQHLAATAKADEALPHLIAALKADPYLPAAYRGLGDAYRLKLDPASAWDCYDIGRLVPGLADAPALAQITALEKELETRYPEFF
jgi:hypothetical protein